MRSAHRISAALAAVLLFAAGCGADDNDGDNGTEETAAADLPAGAVATVNGTEIPRDQLEEVVREIEADAGDLDAEERVEVVEPAQRNALTTLIQAAVFDGIAEDQGIEVTDEDMVATRERMVEGFGSEEELQTAVTQFGLTMTLFDDVIVRQEAVIRGLAMDMVGDEAMETRTTRHILLETQDEADDVVSQLEDGADFAELAQEVSVDPGSGEAGGDLGPQPRGSFVPEFDDAVWEADFNEVIGPIESDFGFHVIEVLEEDVTPADALDDMQVQQMVGPELNELIGTAFAEVEVVVDPAIGIWDPMQNAVVSEDEMGMPEPPMDLEGDLPPELQEQLDQLELELGDAPVDEGDAPADDGDAPADDGDAPAGDGDETSDAPTS